MLFNSYLFLWTLLVLWFSAVAGVVAFYRRDIHRLWREPVLRYPVLTVESDDWGAGPLVQASALRDIVDVLRRFQDSEGRRPVISLAVVLAVPDGPAICADSTAYQRRRLDDPSLASILSVLKFGEAEAVFSLQLHGLEHFWPDTVMACGDSKVQAWLREPGPSFTEQLPSHMQSRWIDAACLPSQPLSVAAIQRAVKEEVEIYREVMACPPRIVVPPTFVWTPVVEDAWAANGIECVITPGQRYVCRETDGASVSDGARFANGDRSGAITYLVRFDYFEPARGRDAAYALRALRRAVLEGRPCILENHRVNFCQGPTMHTRSLQELERLITGALAQAPKVRFLSSYDLLHIYKRRDPEWLFSRFGERFPYFWQRLRHTGRLWKLLRISGAALPGELLMLLKSRRASHSHV